MMSIDEHPVVDAASQANNKNPILSLLDADDHIARLQHKQKRNRELDKELAIAIGYSVSRMSRVDAYILIRPHVSTVAAGGGLFTIRGQGPKQRVPGILMHCTGHTTDDAWEWVPHFTTNPAHYAVLLLHIQEQLRLPVPSKKKSAVRGCREIIQQMRARSGRKSR